MASSSHTGFDLKSQIPFLLKSTTTAYANLSNGVIALDQLQKVSLLLDSVICSLKEERGKYDDLLKVLTALAVQYNKLDVETKSHIRTVKEQARMNTAIIEEAKQQLLRGNDISSYFLEIEGTAKESLASSEEFRAKYDIIISRVKDCCSQAKDGWKRNEHKADLAEKGAGVGLIGGLGVGGSFAAFQVATKALCVFGVPGAVAGGVLGLIGGSVVGGMVGGLPFATAEALFRNHAEKFKILDDTLSTVDNILLENFEVLTEICRLLGKLKKAAKSLVNVKNPSCKQQKDHNLSNPGEHGNEAQSDVASSDHSNSCSNDEITGNPGHTVGTSPANQVDDTNLDFLIQLRFDAFKRASEELEKNCDYFLGDIPLKTMGMLSLDENYCKKAYMTSNEGKKLI